MLTWNAAAERLFGYRADEIVGRSISTLIPPEREEEEQAILAALRAGRSSELVETTRVTRDGRLVPVSVQVSPLRNADGELTGASKVVRDLSDLVAAHDALAQEKELLATTLSSIGDGVITTDAQGRVSFLNPVAEGLTGWSRADATGKPLSEVFRIVNEATRAEVENPAMRAMRDGVIIGLANHTVLLSRTGEERPIDDSGAPIRDARGRVFGSVLVFRDVTERRAIDRRLQRADALSRSVIDHVLDGIITIDESGTVESFNGAAESVFGYSADEVVGRNVRMLMPAPYHGEHDGYLRNYTQTGTPKIIGIGREVVGQRKDRSTFPMELAVSEFYVGDRRFFTGIVRDVSERKRHEAALREADQRKNEFIATLAHELRNPLAPIRNSVSLLELKGPADPELIAARGIIDRQVQQLSRLLDDLLDVNRLGRQKLELRKEHVTLHAVLASAMETARPEIDARRHHVSVEAPKDVVLHADPVRLSQVFANLLNNAAKYMDEGGEIRVAAARNGDDVVVSVKDTGIGIAPESLPKLFEMYTQAPLALERAKGGVGIGLSLARGLVELHGGSISARSDGMDKGSEFVVRLPIAVGAAIPAEEPPQQLKRTRVTRRILIADDVRDNADTFAMMLRALGHEAIVAYDGTKAIAEAERLRPEVALVDIGMPGMDGYDVCRHIRGQDWGREMYLIALTGWGQDEDRQRAARAGFDRHMLKPIDIAALVAVLANLPNPSPRP